tara:strand:+ start:2195 stop:2335 length:141 start_codon:yes stop_codon:yes gene_type:complete
MVSSPRSSPKKNVRIKASYQYLEILRSFLMTAKIQALAIPHQFGPV